jgi:hypothetical protein
MVGHMTPDFSALLRRKKESKGGGTEYRRLKTQKQLFGLRLYLEV